MFSSVLIAVDSWEYTTNLLDLAKRVCADAKVVDLIYVDSRLPEKPEFFYYTDEFAKLILTDEASQQQIIQDALCYLSMTAGIKAKGVLMGGDAAMSIVKYAKEINCDVIIMGHRNLPAISRFFDPSISLKVLKKAHCPVLLDSTTKFGS